MKRKIKRTSVITGAALCAVLLAGAKAKANAITGSIGFSAAGVTVNSNNLADSSSFTVTDPVTTDAVTGTYLAVLPGTGVDFRGFVFNPPAASVDPLWSFQIGSTEYSFDATTVTSVYVSSLQEWVIGGAGMAMVTGDSDTKGTWNVNLSQSGASFVFDSSAAALAVPDGSSAMTLLGSAMIGLAVFRRKLCR